MMDRTENRILSAARAASEIGESSVRIDVAGIPVTVHAVTCTPNESALSAAQAHIAVITNHRRPAHNPAFQS